MKTKGRKLYLSSSWRAVEQLQELIILIVAFRVAFLGLGLYLQIPVFLELVAVFISVSYVVNFLLGLHHFSEQLYILKQKSCQTSLLSVFHQQKSLMLDQLEMYVVICLITVLFAPVEFYLPSSSRIHHYCLCLWSFYFSLWLYVHLTLDCSTSVCL